MENVRTENFLGNRKLIVGLVTQDLVLETLGRVYIKSGRNITILNEVIDKITKMSDQISAGTLDISSKVFFVNNLNELGHYPDGSLVFDLLTGYLYIIIDGKPVLLVETKTANSNLYVRRSGDTMTGLLILNFAGGPSLTVASSAVVPKLNADLLDGYHSTEFARKTKDEKITGNWSFEGKTTFNNQVSVNDNISQLGGGYYTNNYIGTKIFTSGFLGVGWCVMPDNSGYTLTVDNLVVRKAMQVFEMIVNKIHATNGSMWVADQAKVATPNYVSIVTSNTPKYLDNHWFVKFTPEEKNKSYFIVDVAAEHLSNSLQEGRIRHEIGDNSYDLNTTQFIVFTKLYYCKRLTLTVKLKEDDKEIEVEESQETLALDIGEVPDIGDLTPVTPGSDVNEKIDDIIEGPSTEQVTSDYIIEEYDIYEDLTYLTGIVPKEGGHTIDPSLLLAKFKIAPEQAIIDGQMKPNVKKLNGKYVYTKDVDVWTYYKYFGLRYADFLKAINYTSNDREGSGTGLMYVPNLFMVQFESDDAIPTLWEGDIIRCQKFYDHGIRYYDGLVGKAVTTAFNKDEREEGVPINPEKEDDNSRNFYLPVLLGIGGNLVTTEVYYDGDSNLVDVLTELNLYRPDGNNPEGTVSMTIDPILKGDVMVRMGHAYNPGRQGAIYLTSSEDYSPYINMISEVNRPDYSVIYYTPRYKKFTSLNTNLDHGKYLDFYTQNSEFSKVFANNSAFRDLYERYVISTQLPEKILNPNNSDYVEEETLVDTYLTNAITEKTKYTENGPFSKYYKPKQRILYISSQEKEPYITAHTYDNSRDTYTFDNVTYNLGAI